MKREGNLMEAIVDPDNLRLAFWKAAQGKRNKMQILEYQQDLDRNLENLRNSLLTGNVSVGDYHYFTIYDPKERLICAADFGERVLHHALMNVCHRNFEKFQINQSYASRIGKGAYAALSQADIFQKKYAWFLKLDVRKYFDSIDHSVLKNLLTERFKDKKLLLIFDKIIDSYSMGIVRQADNDVQRNKGVPIGNLTSQYFANHYLAVADHYAKEILRIPAYVRYMDDIVMWEKDKKELLLYGKKFQTFLFDVLKLELKPFCLNNTEIGLPFLGYRVCKNQIKLSQQSKRRFVDKLKRYTFYLDNGLWSQCVYQRHILPLLAFVNHADTTNLRKKLLFN